MTHKEIIRKFFEPFQNLNLLVLMDNLREGRVIREDFYDAKNKRMCPLSHGFPCYVGGISNVLPAGDWAEFYNEWDAYNIQEADFFAELATIYNERLADADAVQEVIRPRRRKRVVVRGVRR